MALQPLNEAADDCAVVVDAGKAIPLDYQGKPATRSVPRVWGLSRPVWLLVAVFCAFVVIAGAFATNGRIGRGDVPFVLLFAVLGVAALINALRTLWRAG